MITHIRVKNLKSWQDKRKFIAVAIAYERDHAKKATILQALDRKWEPFQKALEREGVQIDFLCSSENEG
ncbi:MAG: hypothetical protein OXN25_08025 [Candidatus Poribacteria bacterium]|nr:hypothetical protein [Candidatus Poribacteria bacterium]MYK20476.1 hypothetical protein [Candidatus Poribacteria bacterium]